MKVSIVTVTYNSAQTLVDAMKSVLEQTYHDIEYIIGNYVDDMSQELYESISDCRPDFLRDHKRFGDDITQAVERLEKML